MPQVSAEAGCDGAVGAVPLRTALADVLLRPALLLRKWNWKAAALSAMLRAAMFLLINLRAGSGRAVRAMLVEAGYATVAAGFAGAVTQRLRHAVPRRATACGVACRSAAVAGRTGRRASRDGDAAFARGADCVFCVCRVCDGIQLVRDGARGVCDGRAEVVCEGPLAGAAAPVAVCDGAVAWSAGLVMAERCFASGSQG